MRSVFLIGFGCVAMILAAAGCADVDGNNAGAGGMAGAGGGAGGAGTGGTAGSNISFPVTPIALVDGDFAQAEGIAFNGAGELFVVADTDLWQINTDGSAIRVADLVNPVGLAARGANDILVAEFGPLVFTEDGANNDGSVLQVTPQGAVTTIATGIGDPNFIHVRADGTLLVTDDFTDLIYEVDTDGNTSVFLQGIQSPNGLVESLDGSELFVAQTFTNVTPLTFDDRVWRVPLNGGMPGTPELLVEVGTNGAHDGVTLDAQGRLYVAENLGGNVWRIDPTTMETVLIATVPTVASLAFGEGDFNHTSIYATSLFSGTIWEIPIDVEGAPVNR